MTVVYKDKHEMNERTPEEALIRRLIKALAAALRAVQYSKSVSIFHINNISELNNIDKGVEFAKRTLAKARKKIKENKS